MFQVPTKAKNTKNRLKNFIDLITSKEIVDHSLGQVQNRLIPRLLHVAASGFWGSSFRISDFSDELIQAQAYASPWHRGGVHQGVIATAALEMGELYWKHRIAGPGLSRTLSRTEWQCFTQSWPRRVFMRLHMPESSWFADLMAARQEGETEVECPVQVFDSEGVLLGQMSLTFRIAVQVRQLPPRQ